MNGRSVMRGATFFAALLGASLGSDAWACAVCGGGKAPNERAYYDMTIFMSLFPLALIGVVVVAVYYFKLDDNRDGSRNIDGSSDERSRSVRDARPAEPEGDLAANSPASAEASLAQRNQTV